MTFIHGFKRSVAQTILAVYGVLGLAGTLATAEDSIDAIEIVSRVNERLAGRSVSRKIEMIMTSKKGKSRTRRTGSFRKYSSDDLRSVIYYLAPASVRGSAFLTYDYGDPSREDDQWLYLPSIRRPRRVAASNRGDYFMGTDFTFDDVKHETDLSSSDYRWTTDGVETIGETSCAIIAGRPVDDLTASALGYGRIRVWVAKDSWVPIRSEYWDNEGNLLKTILVSEIRLVDNVWTPHRIEARRHTNGHQTVFRITDADYKQEIDDLMFSKRSLDTIPARLR